MKLTEKDGLFSFEAEDIEEMRILRMFVKHMDNDLYELMLRSYSYDDTRSHESNVTGIHLRWKKDSLSRIKNKIKKCLEFEKPIPIEILEEYNKLSAGFL